MDLRASRHGGGAELERDVEQPRRAQVAARADHDVAAPDRVDLRPAQVDGHALPGARAFQCGVVHLDAAHAVGAPARQ